MPSSSGRATWTTPTPGWWRCRARWASRSIPTSPPASPTAASPRRARRGGGGGGLRRASGATPPRRAGPPPLLRGRRALLAAAAALTLLWAGLAVGWLSDWSPREERQLRAILRAYGPGEPYSVPD